jgi:carbamoyl-phosphate synthase small subunit
VSVVDGGAKRNILRLLADPGCRVEVHPIDAKAETWRAGADLVLFTNGPGDPASLTDVVVQIKRLMGQVPLAGICLGHQLLALALGATTYKLRFGHRGVNHPVQDKATGRVEITSQNHGFCVDPEGLIQAGATVSHVHLNDGTVAGLQHDDLRVISVQFHPESCPGPKDSEHLMVERFLAFAGL